MRVLVWLGLIAASVASVAVGRLRLALALACCKALLVGFEFMELKLAAWPHRLAFAGFVVALTLGLTLAARS